VDPKGQARAKLLTRDIEEPFRCKNIPCLLKEEIKSGFVEKLILSK
jgi:hypothetical protein